MVQFVFLTGIVYFFNTHLRYYNIKSINLVIVINFRYLMRYSVVERQFSCYHSKGVEKCYRFSGLVVDD